MKTPNVLNRAKATPIALLMGGGLLLAWQAAAQSLSPPSMEVNGPSLTSATPTGTTQATVMSTATLEVLTDVYVTQIGTYQNNADHFIWFSKRGEQCALATTPVHRFSDNLGSGAALHATLMTALVNQRKLDVRVDGCQVFEVYLR